MTLNDFIAQIRCVDCRLLGFCLGSKRLYSVSPAVVVGDFLVCYFNSVNKSYTSVRDFTELNKKIGLEKNILFIYVENKKEIQLEFDKVVDLSATVYFKLYDLKEKIREGSLRSVVGEDCLV